MPRRQPFTRLCQFAAAAFDRARADLHVHSTASDGASTPSQIILRARDAQLRAVAITDHDTIAGWDEARRCLNENRCAIEFVPGVEISTTFASREWHLLGYGFRPTDAIVECLAKIQTARRERFERYVALLRERVPRFDGAEADRLLATTTSLGRRHLATLLVRSGAARNRFDAFRRFLNPFAAQVGPLASPELAGAVAMIRSAGGFTSLAHPPDDLNFERLSLFAEQGLSAVESEFPAVRRSRALELRSWATRLNLGTTGGSDSHGDERRIGNRTIAMSDLDALRRLAGPATRDDRGIPATSARPCD